MTNNEDRIDNEKIDDIAKRLMNDEFKDTSRRTASGNVEYKFSDLPRTSLEFIDEDEIDSSEPSSVSNTSSPSPMDESADIAPAPAPAPRVRDVNDEEFDIPDEFVVSETYSEPDFFDMAPRIWKTYVPRFTEVTERTYRLRSSNASPSRTDKNSPVNNIPTVKVDRVSGADVDPTLDEIESKSAPAVIVNVDSEAPISKDTMNVFKFGTSEPAVPKVILTDEERERRDITELTGHKWEERREDDTEPTAPGAEEELSDFTEAESETVTAPTEAEPLKESYVAPDDELPENERPLGWDYDPAKVKGSPSYKNEYESYSMRDKYKDSFLDKLLSHKLRMIIGAILALLALALENLPLFGINVVEKIGLGAYPAAALVLDGAIIAALFFIALPETLRAIYALCCGRVIPELSVTFSAIVMLAYTTVSAYNLPPRYPMFAFVYSIMVLSAIFANYCLHSASFTAFKRIADKGNKTVAENRLTRKLERENIALDGMVDEYKSKTARAFKTAFVSDFKANSERDAENSGNNLRVLLLSLGISLTVAVVMFFVGDGILSAFTALAVSVSLSLPAFAILSHKLAFRYSVSELDKSGSTVIGEAALNDFAGTDCITFSDTEVFGDGDVTFKSISLSERGGDFRRAMRQMSSLFATLGGPLYELFRSSLGKTVPPAEDVVIEADGAVGVVDGVKIMAGSFDYMTRHGVYVPSERGGYVESTKVMYGAENGVLFAKLNIQYNFSEEFAREISRFKKYNITPLIYTRDPNISGELVRFLTGGNDLIRVMKRFNTIPEGEKVYRRLPATLVTNGEKDRLTDAVVLAKRYSHLQSHLALTELTASAVGAVLAALISTLGMTLHVPSILIALWQIGWCVTIGIVSRSSFDARKNKSSEKQIKKAKRAIK